jgi:hypothetical protein
LKRVSEIAPSLAKTFALKSVVRDNLVFRLVNDCRIQVETSYIALSYRWNAESLFRRDKQHEQQTFLLPTTPAMFQAVFEERRSEREGLWVDQICINQDDELEKANTIGAMDVIFENARAVIIALDDIKLEWDEAAYLQTYTQGQKSATDDKAPLSKIASPALHDS